MKKMSNYEKELLEIVKATCNDMYNDGKTWFDLLIYVTKFLEFHKKHHNLSKEFVENIVSIQKGFIIIISKTK